MRPGGTFTRALWIAVILLAFIGLAMATRRTVVLLKPGTVSARKGPAGDLDGHFAKERTLTLLHILPGMLFMVLGPLQFVKSLRTKYPAIHRWSGRIFLTASAVIGITGMTMVLRDSIGGADEKAAILVFGSLFLFALGKALWHALHQEFAQHREWMIRGFAIGLAVATIRPIMAGFFAAAVIGGHTPEPSKFFGAAFWTGFTLQAMAAEIWVRWTRRSQFAGELKSLTRA
jgi:drug/metabolite transporter (DMT)-like permease